MAIPRHRQAADLGAGDLAGRGAGRLRSMPGLVLGCGFGRRGDQREGYNEYNGFYEDLG